MGLQEPEIPLDVIKARYNEKSSLFFFFKFKFGSREEMSVGINVKPDLMRGGKTLKTGGKPIHQGWLLSAPEMIELGKKELRFSVFKPEMGVSA